MEGKSKHIKTNSIIAQLKRPYSLETSLTKRWRNCFLFGSFIFLFLLIFQPFGLNELPQGIIPIAFGYGLTTVIIMSVLNIVFHPLFPRFFEEDRWTVGKEICWNLVNIVTIGLGNAFYSAHIGMTTLLFKNILLFEGYTLLVGVFPVIISVLAKESRLNKKYETESDIINNQIIDRESLVVPTFQNNEQKSIRVSDEIKKEIPSPFQLIQKNESITITSENGNEKITMIPNELIFIRSADNYIELFYTQNSQVSKKLLRSSLKAVAESLVKYEQLYRCHKSYLVNLERVNHVSGNAGGYRLHLSGGENLIPVSRQNNAELKDRLSRTPKA